MPKVIHFELPADDPERAVAFYEQVFGWTITKWEGPMDYWLITGGPDDEPGINGAIMARQHPQQPTVNYVDVASIDAAIEKATKLGAKVALPKTSVPGVGAYAAIIDPQGNICGLWEQLAK